MSYETVEERIHEVPEEYLGEIVAFVDYIIYKIEKGNNNYKKENISKYYGCLSKPIDGITYQRSVRDEWK